MVRELFIPLVAVGAGGALGAMGRYLLSGWVQREAQLAMTED